MIKVNIGTYSFGREFQGTLADKLKKAKEIGYDGIELLANDINDNSAEDIKKMAADAGIEIVSSHVAMELITEECLEKFAAVGGKTMIVPSFGFCNKAEAYELGRQLTEKAEMAKKYGIKIGYHNHTTEFFEDEGKCIIEHVMDATKPGEVFFQLDCGWATAAGCDCPAFIRKHSGRFFAIHVKENNKVIGTGEPRPMNAPRPSFPKPEIGPDGKPIISEEMKQRMAAMKERTKIQCPMGDSSSRINWNEVKKALDEQGIHVDWTVERENDYADDIVKCLKEDVQWLKANVK